MASRESTDSPDEQDGRSDRSPDATLSISDVGDGIGDLGLSSDPDAQATVNDFADFTEYLPSDINRSLALIRDLDRRYEEASARVHKLTKLYGALPSLPQDKRIDPAQLRADISESLNDAKQARIESYAEARRMQQNVGLHYDLAKSLGSKLKEIANALPPSGGASPSRPQSSSEAVLATRTLPSFGHASPSHPQSSPQAVISPKLLPAFGDASPSRPQSSLQAARVLKTQPISHDASTSRPQFGPPRPVRASELLEPVRASKLLDNAQPPTAGPRYVHNPARPLIIVPGDVLDPNEVGYDVFDSASDYSDSDTEEDVARTSKLTSGREKIRAGRNKSTRRPNPPKPSTTPMVTVPKPLEAPRPPRAMGTNVRSSVAGISTSDALRECTPPPKGTLPGDPIHAPWFELSKYELAVLRKKMKKNAVWSPSDTMISRELSLLGRGPGGYLKAMSKLKTAPKHSENQLPTTVQYAPGRQVVTDGAIKMSLKIDDDQGNNQGLRLSGARKLLGENKAKELAKLAADEEDMHKLSNVPNVIAGLFGESSPKSGANENTKPVETPRKRQRECNTDTDSTKPEVQKPPRLVIKPQRKLKTETPVPAPQSAMSNALNTLPATNISRESPTMSDTFSISTGKSTSTAPLGTSPLKKSSNTPILPPTKEIKKDQKNDVKTPAVAMTAGPASAALMPSTPPPYRRPSPSRSESLAQARRPSSRAEGPPERRPSSRVGLRLTSSGNVAGVESAPTIARDRPRRSITAYNSPVSQPYPLRSASRQTEHTAPRPAAAGVGKTTAAPRRNAGSKKQLKREGKHDEVWYDIDDNDDDDAGTEHNEPLYCLCNRVSFGMMICCENGDCEKQWFHLPCVDLVNIPPRTTKWYCPECRHALGIGETGEVAGRGRRR